MVYKFGAVDLDRLKAVTTDERITLYHIQVCVCMRVCHCPRL